MIGMKGWWLLVLAGCGASTDHKSFAGDGGAEHDLSAVVLDDGGAELDDGGKPFGDGGRLGGSTGRGGGNQDGAVQSGPCPSEMVHVTDVDAGLDFCVDPYEGYVVEVTDGGEKQHSPFVVVDGLSLRAKTARGVIPQAYISQVEATQACSAAGKRLCNKNEFAEFCRGPNPKNFYPYGGETHLAGDCNEGKGSSMTRFWGMNANAWTYAEFNAPIDNEWDGGLAPTASYPKCVSPWGVYDCVGNLHEWGSDPADTKGHGRFRGGFYGDAEANGPGCLYVTSAHELTYHDYSTGFRCCADVK
jgi:formylglycine-generating enzyme